MKKHLRWIIAIIVLAVMGVAYYYYLANKPADKDATESVADSNSELSYLVSRNIEAVSYTHLTLPTTPYV